MVDWSKIRKEYIQGGVSYRALAAKYGVPLKNLARRAKDENWVDLREQANHNAATKTVEKVSSKNAEIENGVYDAARELLAAFRGCVSSEKKMTATRLKDYGAALKSIQSVLTSAPTELDIREQEARIANLRRQAEADGGDNAAKLVVEGLPEEFTV